MRLGIESEYLLIVGAKDIERLNVYSAEVERAPEAQPLTGAPVGGEFIV